ncbi:hypothetical protein KI387_003077, partial [Taxus chinensis]
MFLCALGWRPLSPEPWLCRRGHSGAQTPRFPPVAVPEMRTVAVSAFARLIRN